MDCFSNKFALCWFAGLCWLAGCSTPKENRGAVSAELQRRTGFDLPAPSDDRPSFPPSVTLEDGLSEDEVVTLALWKNAAFQEMLADLGLSWADVVQAGMLPNPTLSMLLPIGAKPLELTAKYPVEAIWLRPRRIAAAKLDYDRATQRLVQSGLDLIRDARLACTDLTLARERLELAQTLRVLAEGLLTQTQARLRSGEASELEATSGQIEVSQAREQSNRATHEHLLALERVKSMAGLGMESRSVELHSSPLEVSHIPELNLLLTNALSARPDFYAARLGLEAAGSRVGLARSEVYTLTAALNAKEVGNDFLTGPALDVSIPIINQNQGGVALAKAKFEKASRQYLALRDRIMLEVREAHTRLAQAQESYESWQTQILPSLEEAVLLAERSVAAGNETSRTVLENGRKLADARLKSATAAAELRRARAELERSVGQRLPPNSPP
ncbi:MAG: TolC family protein [Verrucomicrobiales bacterium]|nr:TolC family protein [Verrucomicrobiales bacterium]